MLKFDLFFYFYFPLPPSVCSDALRGTSPQASAQVLQWVSFADADIVPSASAWVFPTLGIMQFNKQVRILAVYALNCLFTQTSMSSVSLPIEHSM